MVIRNLSNVRIYLFRELYNFKGSSLCLMDEKLGLHVYQTLCKYILYGIFNVHSPFVYNLIPFGTCGLRCCYPVLAVILSANTNVKIRWETTLFTHFNHNMLLISENRRITSHFIFETAVKVCGSYNLGPFSLQTD